MSDLGSHKYSAYGVCLESDVSLQGFSLSAEEQPDIRLLRNRGASGGMGALPESSILLRSHYNRPQGGRGDFAYYSFDSHFVARWDQLCDFQVFRDGGQIVCHPWPEVPWENIKPYLLGRALPLALSLRGVLTFHGGAVLSPQGVIGLLARSGTGKSTLVSNLTCSGWPLVCDDVMAVQEDGGQFVTQMGPTQVRLTKESLGYLRSQHPLLAEPVPDYDKSSVCLRKGEIVGNAWPLRAMYFLSRRGKQEVKGIRVSTITPKEALPILTRYISNHVLLELPHMTQHFGALTRLVGQVPVKILDYPSGFQLLPEVCQAVREDCELMSSL